MIDVKTWDWDGVALAKEKKKLDADVSVGDAKEKDDCANENWEDGVSEALLAKLKAEDVGVLLKKREKDVGDAADDRAGLGEAEGEEELSEGEGVDAADAEEPAVFRETACRYCRRPLRSTQSAGEERKVRTSHERTNESMTLCGSLGAL